MPSKYEVGQKVTIAPVREQPQSPRDSDLEAYAGRSGKITDFYWISTGKGDVFYIYNVQIDADDKHIVLHEDELQAHAG